jgi:LPXTG-site transpeptidase (sortase) family protein
MWRAGDHTWPRSRRAIATAAAVLLVSQALVIGVASRADASPPLGRRAGLAVSRVARPNADTYHGLAVRLVRSLEVDLPEPEPAPVDAYAPTPEVRHGTLEMPAIGVAQPFFEGVTLTAINRGPSHWPGTAMPGELGNVVIAGHRTTYSRPMNRLDELKPGDELVFTTAAGRFVYALTGIEIVTPDQVGHVLQQRFAHTATLFGCHPKGSARYRIVARFELRDPPAAPG